MNIEIQSEVQGLYSLCKFKVDVDGKEIEGSRQEIAPFKNLITNAGLDRMGAFSDWMQYCQVGSGSTPASVNDGALVAKIAAATPLSAAGGIQSSAPYYASKTLIYQFNAGVAAGNISEVGIGWLAAGGLFSRALIVDGSGTPTTITVLADEILQVTYQFRYYVPTTDKTGTITLDGVQYAWTSRAAQAASASGWSIGAQVGQSAELRPGSTSFQLAFDGAISAAVTGSPTGTGFPCTLIADAAYSAGSNSRAGSVTWGINDANAVGGLGAVVIAHGIGTFQVGFAPKIPKTSAQQLILTFTHSWARKTI